jgi:hypothetical protein
MTPGIFVFALSILVVTLFWLWRSYRIRRLSSILPIFLFGYFIVLSFKGIGHDAETWYKAEDVGDYLLLFGGNMVVAFILGWIGVLGALALAAESRTLCQIHGYKLILHTEDISETIKKVSEQSTPVPDLSALQLARQLAIDECAEEARRYIIENNLPGIANYQDTENIADRLKEFLLSLGGKESTYVG